MKAVLTSTNKAKVEATKRVLLQLYPGLELETIDVESGVSATPMSEDEGIQGCLHRIEEGKKNLPDADLYIAFEGILSKNEFGTFISNWCAIEQPRKGRIGLGCSAKARVPEMIAQKINNFQELDELIKQLYSSDLLEKMPLIGTIGIITDGLYTRVKLCEDALITTIGYLQNEKNFTE